MPRGQATLDAFSIGNTQTPSLDAASHQLSQIIYAVQRFSLSESLKVVLRVGIKRSSREARRVPRSSPLQVINRG
jgi:hypothetical protein